MPLTPINVGAAANDNTGDSLRNAFIKVNDNCTYLDGKAPNAHTHPLSQLTQSGATSGQVPTWNGTAWAPSTPAGAGTVTSVGLSLPNIFNVTGSPVTGSGTLTAAFTTQTAGTVLAAPINSNAAPSFRALVASDIPALNYEAAGAVAAHAALTDTAHGMTVYGADFVTAATASAARTKLALGTSATLNVPAAGDATTAQVVLGTDTRLTNARTPTAHVHAAGDITSGTLDIGRIPTGTSSTTVCIGNDSRLSDSRTPLSHVHGNISNAGAIGSAANLPLITTASGVITTGVFGTAANTFCQGNDTRLSDARTPTAHTHALGDLTQSGATNGQVVSWNGASWAPANVAASQNTFSTIAIAGQSSVVADATSDTLTLVAGTNVTLTTDATTDTITISASGGSGGGGNVSGPNSGITDNAIVRWDLVNTQIQNSVVTVSDTGEFAGANSVAFSTSPNGSSAIGKVLWDTTNKTLSLGIGAGSVAALLGVDSHILVRNTTGSQINKGQVVRVNGASSGNMTVALAQGNNDANTTTTIGVAAENIANSGTGMVVTTGLLGGLDTSTWAAGDMLFISHTTPGLLVNAAPTAPNHAVRMGYVVSSNPNSGIIYVNVDNGYELDELHDVAYPTTVANNDFLVYTTNRWENKTPANARTALGLGTLATQSGTFSGTSSGTNTGDQTITLTGDVTGTGTGSFAATIASGAVTYAKIQNVSATNKILGRSSIGAGVIQEIDCTAAGRALIGAADVASQRTVLELGTAALSSSTDFAATTHAHGNITSAGAIGVTANLPLITTTSGVVTTGSFGTAANTFCQGNDSRLADSRTPTAHAASHGSGGADALTLAQSQITNLTTDLAAKAPLASPALSGTPTSTTATADTNTTQIATTAFVVGQASATTPAALGTAAVGTSLKYARADHVHALPTIDVGTGITGTLAIANGGTGQTSKTNAFDALAPTTTKGDIVVYDGTDNVRLPVGATNGHVLQVDSTAATGLKWAAASGGSGGGSTNVWIPAAQWIPRTTTGCGIDSRELTTNKINTDELLFDAATAEYAQAMIVMPSNYNAGTVTAKFHWTASTGSGDVVWGLKGRSYANDDALDQAMGTGQTATDTLTATNDLDISPATSGITIGGTVASGNPVIFEVYRDAAAGGDTLGADARLLGVEISYTAS